MERKSMAFLNLIKQRKSMASSSSAIPPPTPCSPPSLFAAIDMGTNSFKLLIVRAHPTGRFLPLLRRKDPVLLGRRHYHQTPTSPFAISAFSELRALKALNTFQTLLRAHNIPTTHTRCVATSAVREAANKSEFLENVREKTGLEVEVLSGEEEARLVYLGTLQFFPVFEKLVLCVDIGGGSTEFVVGKGGNVVFARSLNLGHVSLSQRGFGQSEMREYVRSVMEESGLVEDVKGFGFEVVVGSSGTIQALEKAVFDGYGDNVGNNVFGVGKRDWRLSRGELRAVVERLCGEGEEESERRERFFKRRSEFIVAGAVLLEEIFEALGVEEMEVSGFALAEGVVAEILSKACESCDLNANARWRSVVRLATRFDGKKRMVAAAQCAAISKEIFEELRKCEEFADNQVITSLDEKDLEYLEAACMLHNIGHFTGKKGYHKQSYRIIMNGDHLHGYSAEEIKLIALLARHHRKKLPKLDHSSFKEIPKEVKKKVKVLCAVIRVSVALWQHQCRNNQEMQSSYSYEGFNFKSVFSGLEDRNLLSSTMLPSTESENTAEDLRQELEYFKKVFHQDLSVVVSSWTLE